MKICKQCNIEYEDNMKFCPECGSKLEVKPNVCPNCGAEYKDGQKFCSECGTKLENSSVITDSYSPSQIEDFYREGIELYDLACDEEEGSALEISYFQKAFENFSFAAKSGHAGSQQYLGMFYKEGYGIDIDIQKSQEWYKRAFNTYKKASESGDISATVELGRCYRFGYGVDIDESKAVELFKLSAEKGNSEGQYMLAHCFYYEIGTAKDIETAVKWFTKAAEHGHTNSQSHLGMMYELGDDVTQDPKQAFYWYKKAAESGDAFSASRIGNFYRLGEGVEKNAETACEWYLKAASHGGYNAMFQLGDYYLQKMDFADAFDWFTKAVKSGKNNTKASERLDIFFNSDGTFRDPDNSNETGTKKKIDTMLYIAKAYMHGNYEDKDKANALYEQVLTLYKQEAKAGSKDALDILVRYYCDKSRYFEDCDPESDFDIDIVEDPSFFLIEKTLRTDDGEALKWISKAVDYNNSDALFLMGCAYYNGWDVERDKTKAISYFRKAAEQGKHNAQKCADIIELEQQWNIDELGQYGIYWVEDGVTCIEKGLLEEVDGEVIHLPSSVNCIKAEAFADCYFSTIVCDSPKTIRVESMKGLFKNCEGIENLSFLADWILPQNDSFEETFYNCNLLSDISPLANLDVSTVCNMKSTFAMCKSLEDLTPLANWDVSKVKNMNNMFGFCAIKSIAPLAGWNVSNVTDFGLMFSYCSDLSDISAFKAWAPFVKNRYISYEGLLVGNKSVTDISALRSLGFTETQIVQDILWRFSETRFDPHPESKAESANETVPVQVNEAKPVLKESDNSAIDKCIPNVFFVKVLSFDITFPDGKRKQMDCDSAECTIPAWTGTGFLLADGRFVTARHVVEAWAFVSSGGEVDQNMVALNIVANNGGKVVAKFKAISSDGTQIVFYSDQCSINRSKDIVSTTDKGSRIVVAQVGYNDTDYVYFNTGKTTGLAHNNAASTSLTYKTELIVLGFPLGIGANSDNDITPIYGSGIVAKSGLHNGVILTTDTNYEQGNSGGPVFKTNSNSELEVIGLVSAGAGRTMGFIVPIAAVK